MTHRIPGQWSAFPVALGLTLLALWAWTSWLLEAI